MVRLIVNMAAVVVLMLAVVGCQGDRRSVIAIEPGPAAQPLERTMTVTEKGTYYLYSTKEPGEPRYKTDMKKGDTLGFRASGDRAQAVANGIKVELSEYAEGAGYEWKIEEKK